MPTGYTAELMEKGESFNSFVLHCARAFGALVMMRDEPKDAPIPETFKPSDYYIKALAKAKKEHKILSTMTNDEKIAFGTAEKEKNTKHHMEWLAKATMENERLTEMQSLVRAWKPPTGDHQGLKDFMLDQIKISMNNLSYTEREIAKDQEKSPMAFYVAAVSSAEWNIKYYIEENTKEIERSESRTKWVNQLRASLGE
jgi:hypothetical protein